MFPILLIITLSVFPGEVFPFNSAENPTVSLPNGDIQGTEITFDSVKGAFSFYSYQQIPYAQPPLGNLRFQPPKPALNWTGLLNCTETTRICYQMQATPILPESEDCLHLSVYTPNLPGTSNSSDSLPVMFYIHGGGFISGSNTLFEYGPHYFMLYNVVVVVINYRVGPFGFLSTGDSVLPGNNGLKDQLLALKWTKSNIKHFGGDPKRVTIFGQSAGGASVTYHMLSRQSKGLFHAAIAQSGTALAPFAYQRDAPRIARQLARFIDGNFSLSSNSMKVHNFLLNSNAKDIQAASNRFKDTAEYEQMVQGYYFAPVVEPNTPDAFLTELPFESLLKGKINKVPLMLGFTSEEQQQRAQNITQFKINVEEYERDLRYLVPLDLHQNKNPLLSHYLGMKIRRFYTNGKLAEDLGGAVRYFSDTCFNRSTRKFVELVASVVDVYFYQFSYHGRLGINTVFVPDADRVTHNEDRRYLWSNFYQTDLSQYIEADRRTLDRYLTLFTNFAKYHNPIPGRSALFGNTTWPKVKPGLFQYLNINESLSVAVNPKQATYKQWLELYDRFASKPLDTY